MTTWEAEERVFQWGMNLGMSCYRKTIGKRLLFCGVHSQDLGEIGTPLRQGSSKETHFATISSMLLFQHQNKGTPPFSRQCQVSNVGSTFNVRQLLEAGWGGHRVFDVGPDAAIQPEEKGRNRTIFGKVAGS